MESLREAQALRNRAYVQVKNKLTNPSVEPFSGKITRPFTYLLFKSFFFAAAAGMLVAPAGSSAYFAPEWTAFFSPSTANEFIDENAPDNAVFTASRCSSDRIGSFFPGLPDLRSDDSDESWV